MSTGIFEMSNPSKAISRGAVLINWQANITDEEIANWPLLPEELARHLATHPLEKWNDKAFVFQSAGATGELLYVLYDDSMWQCFVDDFHAALNSLHPNSDSCEIAFVGSKDFRHTLPRLAHALDRASDVIGLQDPFTDVIKKIEKQKPDIIVCYGGFIEMLLQFVKHTTFQAWPKFGFVLTTEGVSPRSLDEILVLSGAKSVSVLSSTELGVMAHTCEFGNYHLNDHLTKTSLSDQTVFSNTANALHRFQNYTLPVNFVTVRGCECGSKKEAFVLQGGRQAQIFLFLDKSGKENVVHSIFFRSYLDALPGFPGANLKATGNTLSVILKKPYDVEIVRRTILAAASQLNIVLGVQVIV